MRSTLPTLLVLVLFLGYIDLPAGGQPTYLISPASADTTVFAYAINDSGQITGVYQPNSTIRAFLQQNGVILNLGTFGGSQSTGYAVSPNGLAVGYANTATNAQHAYLTDNGGPIQDLGTLGGAVSQAFGVNSAGQVVGYSWITVGSSTRRAFLYTGGTMQNLGTLSGGTNSTAYGINEAGDVVGESSTSTPNGIFNHAYLYADGGMIDLGTLGGNASTASDISNRGLIVGSAYLSGTGGPHACLWKPGVTAPYVPVDLGLLAGHVSSHANAINDAAKVVGYSRFTDQSERAIIYRASRLEDLNNLIPAGSGWTLSNARGISESGSIVGMGVYQNRSRAFLLTPLYTVSYSPHNPSPGSTVTISWTRPVGTGGLDWIGLYKVGEADSAYRWWTYTGADSSGSANLVAPTQPGEYEFRYFYNNGYRLLEVSAPFTILAENVNATLGVSATSVLVSAPLSVSWTVDAGRPAADWIGLYKVGDPNTAYGWWRYTNGAVSGTFDLTAPAEPGQYEFRYLLNNGYIDAAVSPTVTVSRPSGSYTLTASPGTVAPGGSISINWTAPAGSAARDWIGIYKVGDSAYNYGPWFYTGGSESGTRLMSAPAAPGRYEFRYYLDNGFTEAARSNEFLVE